MIRKIISNRAKVDKGFVMCPDCKNVCGKGRDDWMSLSEDDILKWLSTMSSYTEVRRCPKCEDKLMENIGIAKEQKNG